MPHSGCSKKPETPRFPGFGREHTVRFGPVKRFFSMDRAESRVLLFLILFSFVSFLPVWRGVEIAGMAVFGWLMAALMVLSPAITLTVFLRQRRRK